MATMILSTEREKAGKWKWELGTITSHFLSVFRVYIFVADSSVGLSGSPVWWGSWLRWCSFGGLTIVSCSSLPSAPLPREEKALFVFGFPSLEPPSLSSPLAPTKPHLQPWPGPHALRPALAVLPLHLLSPSRL